MSPETATRAEPSRSPDDAGERRSRAGLRILYTHRTQGIGAEGAHVMGMVEAFRELGHVVEIDCLPGCDPFERNGLNGPADESGGRAGGRSRARAAYRLVADRAPQAVFGAAELAYNAPLLARLGWKMRRRPDLVYERYAVGTAAPSLLCRALHIPMVLEVNDSVTVARGRPTSFPRIKRRLERRVLESADLIVTITRHFQDRLLEAYPGLDPGRVLVLPNAVSTRFAPRPAAAGEALRAELGLGRRPLLGNVGQFLPWHGLAPFVSAAAPLARERDLGFLFIGDGPVRQDVLAAARAGGVEDRVTFTGLLPHARVPDYLALLDAAVIPAAAAHASPMKLMEFMAMGLPVVAPDLPNIRAVLEDGRTGRLFRPEDMGHLCRELELLLADRATARVMGRRAREYVLAHLTWTGHARDVLGALDGRGALRGPARIRT